MVGVLIMYSNRLFISVAQAGKISRKVNGLIWVWERVFSCSRDKEWILIRAKLCIICILAGLFQPKKKRTDESDFWGQVLTIDSHMRWQAFL